MRALRWRLVAVIAAQGIVALAIVCTSELARHGRRSTTLALVALLLGTLTLPALRKRIGPRGVGAVFLGIAPLAYPMGKVLGRYREMVDRAVARGIRLDRFAPDSLEWRLDTFYGDGNWRSVSTVALSWAMVAAVVTVVATLLPKRAVLMLGVATMSLCIGAVGAALVAPPASVPNANFAVGCVSALTAAGLLLPLLFQPIAPLEPTGTGPYRTAEIHEAKPTHAMHAAMAVAIALFGAAPLLRMLSD